MRVLLLIALAGWLSSPSPSAAENQPVCANAQTTIEIGECVRKAFNEADAELNAVWKKVMASFETVDYMPADDLKAWKDTLLASQRDWIKFKEEDCAAVGYEWFGGTGRSNAEVFCLLDHTTARTKDLKARFLDR
ncbi:MAG: lysozyme inhibitor LprI family protein [Pseudomonadota bacterium]